MNGKLFFAGQLPLLCLHLVCMAALALFLLVSGNSIDSILLIILIWLLILTTYLVITYHTRNTELKKLLALSEQLKERYLISEIMEKPVRADDQVYYQILKASGKSMLEQVSAVKRQRLEYQEYIEQWVHEMKTPLTAMKLLCENHRLPLTRELLPQLEKLNRFTEQVLYYARSEHTEKDYSVREIRLFDVVHQSIAENKHLLLQCGVKIELSETEETVFSDEKWLCFILNQIIVNAVKYRTNEPVLHFFIEKSSSGSQNGREVILCVKDNGIGIHAHDLPRIFEKGFTGANGRVFSENPTQNATGMGLYLCKRLCDKLGIGISASSSQAGTVFRLSFQVNDLLTFL